jgi:hypothetical protein
MEDRTGNSNRHNRDSIGQIKDTTRGQIREDQHKEFDQDFNLPKIFGGSDAIILSALTFLDIIHMPRSGRLMSVSDKDRRSLAFFV